MRDQAQDHQRGQQSIMKRHSQTLILVLVIILVATSNIAYASQTNEKPLYDEAIKLVNIGTDEEIFELFLKQRPTPLSPDRRAFYKKELFNRPELAHTRLLDSNTQEAQAVLEIVKPVLGVLGRYRWQDAVDIVVLDQKAPFIGLYRESIFIVTTSVIKLLTPDQLRASLAHELAHECFIEELIAADRAQDVAAHHLVEYKCDLIATIALNGLGQDPFTLVEGIARIKSNGAAPDTSSHPESADRKNCLKEFLSVHQSTSAKINRNCH